MGLEIKQQPLYGNATNGAAPVGQQIVFTVNNLMNYLNLYFNVKYLAELHVSNTTIDVSSSDNLVAVFKTTPNNAGAGIFDFRSLLESFVSADNRGFTNGIVSSKYKGQTYDEVPHPIHIIDKFSRSENSVRFFKMQFKAEGSLEASGVVQIINIANRRR